MKNKSVFTSICFMLLFAPITILSFGSPIPEPQLIEQRALVLDYKWSWHDISGSLSQFESYFKDNFWGRRTLIWVRSQIFFVLGISPKSDSVYLGKDGWLFYNSPEDGNSLRKSLCYIDVTSEDKERWAQYIEFSKKWGDSSLVFFIAPNKETIYPELIGVPPRQTDACYLSEMRKYFKENLEAPLVDSLPAVMKAKAIQQTYYKTDTHWNSYGAYIGTKALLERLSEEFSLASGPLLPEPTFTAVPRAGGDLVNIMGMNPQSMEDTELDLTYQKSWEEDQDTLGLEKVCNCQVVRTKNPSALIRKRLVMFRDSFASAMQPYVSSVFSEVIFLWTPSLEVAMQVKDLTKADIFVLQKVERYW